MKVITRINMEGLPVMKSFTKILQHPLLKLFIAPLAFILYGAVMGAQKIGQYQWINLILLYCIVTCLEIISHFFYVRYDQQKEQQAPLFILFACEILLITLLVIFIIRQHWIISLLTVLAVAYKHLVYFPNKFSNSPYHAILNLFFYTFIWNIIAYFTQASGVYPEFIYTLIPLVLGYGAVELEQLKLKHSILRQGRKTLSLPYPYAEGGLVLLGLAVGVSFSLPSHTYYIMEMITALVAALAFVPIMVTSTGFQQSQNKINYTSSFYFIYVLTYLLSSLF